MVGGARSDVGATRPHGNPRGTYELGGGGSENSQFRGPKLLKTVENGKMNQICRFDRFFGWLARKDIKLVLTLGIAN